ncbi:hypothetical protein QYE76_041044 [Lolium multiflorum]|uniref:Uncharacterized protein n=1 Tax=Lolium multiflorum TaxID=4521 RepID=A0AAD8TD14_LOLMU|nr:hypothetical protein QYE76_041044 [Lolium multiflorum]
MRCLPCCRRTSKPSTTTAGAFAIIASLQDMVDAEAEKRKRPHRVGSRRGRRKSKPRHRMEGHTMLHNDYFADGATHVDNFRPGRMSKGMFMNILHGVREFDPTSSSSSTLKDVERAFGVLQAQFAIVRYPALSWSHDQMWEVKACVIMHNMIIEDDRKNHAKTHVGLYEYQSPLAEVDHELPANFADFLAMHAEICDSNVHDQLQADLVEHLWRIKGNTVTP